MTNGEPDAGGGGELDQGIQQRRRADCASVVASVGDLADAVLKGGNGDSGGVDASDDGHDEAADAVSGGTNLAACRADGDQIRKPSPGAGIVRCADGETTGN